jgi:hypothetical protein
MIVIKCFGAALTLVALSCKDSTLKSIETASYSNLKEERLGQSSYYIKFPSTMFIDETRGKEGQLGYGLWQIDSINRYLSPSGFIEIKHGRPIGWEPDCDIVIEKVRSNLLNGTINWRICKSETGNYYSAIAYHGKLTLSATARTQSGLDSMIAIIATLSSR